jgi:hypothetical protein
MNGWIGVDLDGTLAHYDRWRGDYHIGEPIPAMVNRVKRWLSEGREVRILTARTLFKPVRAWCKQHLGTILHITNRKDQRMIELWDDRAVQVIRNTGKRVDGCEGEPE